MNIKKIILEEMDDFDWVKPMMDVIPFQEAKVHKTYRIRPTEVLMEALRNCGYWQKDWLMDSKMATVSTMETIEYSQVNCGSQNKDEVLSLLLNFYHPDTNETYTFWVTEDMVYLYDSDHTLKEEVDDFKWMEDVTSGVPVTIEQLKAGNGLIVRISKDSRYYCEDCDENITRTNPPNTDGIIKRIIYLHEDDGGDIVIHVEWPNGIINSYFLRDLTTQGDYAV
jgi:hypothetical protein